jgi:prefoldin subunit 5
MKNSTDTLARLSKQIDSALQLLQRNSERLDKMQCHLDNARKAFDRLRKLESVGVSA